MSTQQFSLIDKLPQSIEIEKLVLGYLIQNGKDFKIVRETINGHDFALPAHKTLFIAMEELYKKYRAYDYSILLDSLRENRSIDAIGGEMYIVELLEPSFTQKFEESLETYVRIIKEKAMLRKIQEKCVVILDKCRQHNLHSLTEMEKEIFDLRDIANSNTQDVYKPFGTVCRDTLLGLVEKPTKPISTGFIELDKILGGFYKKQLTIISAETSMGKSALAQNMFLHGNSKGYKIAYLTLEMTNDEMAIRAMQVLTGFPFNKIREMNISSEEFIELTHAIEYYEKFSGFISDKNLNINDIKKTTRKLKDDYNIDVLFVDHLHFITGTGRHENRAIEIGEYCRELKFLAKELDVSIVLLAQINRSSSKQMDRRPDLSDLKDSSSIEQHADNVLFIYREWIHNKESDPNLAEIIIAKNRNGERNRTVNLHFQGSSMTFSTLEQDNRQKRDFYGTDR